MPIKIFIKIKLNKMNRRQSWNWKQEEIINMLCEKCRHLADNELDKLKEYGVISSWNFLAILEL